MNMISRVTKIKDCPSFVDFRPGTELPEFKKYNLIYGWSKRGGLVYTLHKVCLKENMKIGKL